MAPARRQPIYTQLAFALDRVKALAPGHPEWKTTEPFASLLRGDLKGALAGGDHAAVIPPEQVVGSAGQEKFEVRNGTPVLVKLPSVDFVDDREGKPLGIQKFIGRRPIAAFGNSDGDQQMLEWTTAGHGARFALLVHHTDSAREWAYDRESSVGNLDKALQEAADKGWTVVSMKDDWKTIFGK